MALASGRICALSCNYIPYCSVGNYGMQSLSRVAFPTAPDLGCLCHLPYFTEYHELSQLGGRGRESQFLRRVIIPGFLSVVHSAVRMGLDATPMLGCLAAGLLAPLVVDIPSVVLAFPTFSQHLRFQLRYVH